MAHLSSQHRIRAEQHARFDDMQLPIDYDDEVDSPSPIYDQFLQVGHSRGIHELTNFSAIEFETVWSSIAVETTAIWGRHRGPTCRHTAKDVFFMTASVFKNGGKWLTNALVFNIKSPTFQHMITKFISLVSPILYDAWVANVGTDQPMEHIVTSGSAFDHYPCARYATDVTFQQTNTPIRNPDTYYSQKHHLHGLKVEVSVLPTGHAIHCTKAYPGTESYITIFRKNIDFHLSALLKKPGVQERIQNIGPLLEQFEDSWAVLVDKGYVRLAHTIRAIHPMKKPHVDCLPLLRR
ncbi:hypothetical protein LEN26_002982 [Aphanomyces euteiches]|nr:hypothetical protein AeMF1_012732 [Aphanomyces euteiches]KAH9113012.1 hypothetical protein AeMF1_012733 [Aphanomyces euteiches]KAH9158427.1 hypothetical protein LEN26_002981 [Aphanomyces euteiches]KAH9158428.1 hypothetical protein LEN26_002982 [Aphanomyces euteiches]KAH9168962.1 hypothetical protein AeNC1_017814 [Aphanomyces euteiches]